MNDYLPLINPVMKYEWGAYGAIQELLGEKHPGQEPMAELWMGAHPKAPSMVEVDGHRISLNRLIQEHPQEILGASTAASFSNQLPFLFKVLAARQPLSVQAHPNADQAKAGFERENDMDIPLSAPNRNYRDANHKPECICALSEFWAMCGFRPPEEIADLFEKICPNSTADIVRQLRQPAGGRLKSFLSRLLQSNTADRQRLVDESLANTAANLEKNPVAYWIHCIAADFPDDIGILAPVFLNLIRLSPKDGLFLPSGSLHAYLRGTGIEIMANSDNVLRGGLTSKHVDVDELLRTLDFTSRQPEVIRESPLGMVESDYSCPAGEFKLSVLNIEPDSDFRSGEQRNVEILLCTEGAVQLVSLKDSGKSIEFTKGRSALVPASAPSYKLAGKGVLYRAGVP